MGRVDGKVAIVTGAAGGIGKVEAAYLAREGAQVIITDVLAEIGEETAKELGHGTVFMAQDVTQEDAWISLMDTVMSRYGRLDVLVNNAAAIVMGDIENTTLEMWNLAHAVSAGGCFLGCKYALPAMRQSGGGSIINISSIAALRGEWYVVAYAAAKGSVRSLTQAVAVHCTHHGYPIRCNSIHPGPINRESAVETELSDSDLDAPQALGEMLAGGGNSPIATPGAFSSKSGTADDIANAALYLASDESTYVNGLALVVDGGITTAAGVSPDPAQNV